MHVDIWSDVACPWCYVGTQRFGRAVQETGVDVDVVYRSFELDPRVPVGDDSPLAGRLPRAEVRRPEPGAGGPRPAHLGRRRAGHRLPVGAACGGPTPSTPIGCWRWALHDHGADQQRALKQRLLHAYFTDGLDVADHERARRRSPATSASTATRRRALLASDAETDFVHAERAEAYGNGITAVPTFVIEGEWMLQGAHETEKWVKALTHIRDELAAADLTHRNLRSASAW